MSEQQKATKRRRESDPTKHRGGHLTSKRHRKVDLRNTGRGIIVTAGSAHSTQEALREALELLNTAKCGTVSAPPPPKSEISATIDAEIAQLREDSERFVPIDHLTKGVCFIQFSWTSDQPNELIHRILEKYAACPCKETDQEAEKIAVQADKATEHHEEKGREKVSCRFMNRLIPTELTCPPHMNSFIKAARRLVQAYFPESALVIHPEQFAEVIGDDEETSGKTSGVSEPEDKKDSQLKETSIHNNREVAAAFTVPKKATWCVEFERRAGMKTLNREAVVDTIGKMVGDNYTVNLGHSDYSILIEVNNVFCGMSVVRDFHRLLRYNIHRLCHPEETKDEKIKDK